MGDSDLNNRAEGEKTGTLGDFARRKVGVLGGVTM